MRSKQKKCVLKTNACSGQPHGSGFDDTPSVEGRGRHGLQLALERSPQRWERFLLSPLTCTCQCNSWTESRVRSHRSNHGSAVYRDGETAERGEVTLVPAARLLSVSKLTVLRLFGRGAVRARQV